MDSHDLFQTLQIDEKGLTDMDIKYLNAIVKKFNGGPAGVTTLASALSEDKQTIEEFIEPYLIQIGFIKKTPRGRVATKKAYSHLNLSFPADQNHQQRLV